MGLSFFEEAHTHVWFISWSNKALATVPSL